MVTETSKEVEASEETAEVKSVSALVELGEQKGALATEEEKKKIEQIRANCEEAFKTYPHDVTSKKMQHIFGDLRMLRWLRSRDGNVEEATEAFKLQLLWRIEAKMDEISAELVKKYPTLDQFLPYLEEHPVIKHMPLCLFAGETKNGHIVEYDFQGNYTPRNLMNDMSDDDIIMEMDKVYEWVSWYCDRKSYENNGHLVYLCRITDLHGMSAWKHFFPRVIRLMKRYVSGLQDHFAGK